MRNFNQWVTGEDSNELKTKINEFTKKTHYHKDREKSKEEMGKILITRKWMAE